MSLELPSTRTEPLPIKGKISIHVDDVIIINLFQSEATHMSTCLCHGECEKGVEIRQNNKKEMRNGNNGIWNK